MTKVTASHSGTRREISVGVLNVLVVLCLQTEVLAILVAVVVLSVGYKEEVVHL